MAHWRLWQFRHRADAVLSRPLASFANTRILALTARSTQLVRYVQSASVAKLI